MTLPPGDDRLKQKDNPAVVWPGAESTANIAFTWLLHLRWGAVFCQAILILVAYSYLEIAIPLFFVLIIILFEALSNLFFTFFYRRSQVIPERIFGLVMILDIIFLTALLYYTGGPINPFTFLYLVHIALGAILMSHKWSWGLTFFTVLCYSTFFLNDQSVFEQIPLLLPGGYIGGDGVGEACHSAIAEYTKLSSHMQLHLKGMLLAFTITAFFIVFFVGRIQKALAQHQKTLDILDKERTRSEKLASLATLSAGAAHEFSTPLSTIAVAAGEMLHHLKKEQSDHGLIEDAQLIKNQVKVCKDVLYQMAADAGEHLGEGLEKFSVQQIISTAVNGFSENDQARIRIENTASEFIILVPTRTLVRTIKGLIKNALDASPADAQIILRCFCDENFLYFQVEDKGSGMDEDVLAKATEPFFTTKGQGKGLGLGLFLAQNVAEQLGGTLLLSSRKSHGTTATISFALKHIGVA